MRGDDAFQRRGVVGIGGPHGAAAGIAREELERVGADRQGVFAHLSESAGDGKVTAEKWHGRTS